MRRVQKDKGAVLLTTLLVMSIMSALAVAMMDDIRIAIKRAGNIEAHAQAEWYVRAGEDFAISYIQKNFLKLDQLQQNNALKNPIMSSLPLEGGVMQLTIMDGSRCFPLSSLQTLTEDDDDGSGEFGDSFGDTSEGDETGDETDRETGGGAGTGGTTPSIKPDEILKNLLTGIGLTDIDANSLSAAIVDWQDEDQQITQNGAEDYTYLGLTPPYRTPNAPFMSVSELRAVRGMNEEILQTLLPFLCTGDDSRTSPSININTLRSEHLPLLAAMIGPDEEKYASKILTSRPADGFESDLASELTALGVDAVKAPNDISYQPTHLWLEADIKFGTASRTVLLEFSIDSGEVTRTYRHYGTEGRRPVLPTIEENEEAGR